MNKNNLKNNFKKSPFFNSVINKKRINMQEDRIEKLKNDNIDKFKFNNNKKDNENKEENNNSISINTSIMDKYRDKIQERPKKEAIIPKDENIKEKVELNNKSQDNSLVIGHIYQERIKKNTEETKKLLNK